MKNRLWIVLFFYHSILLANPVNDVELKELGRALANYHSCSNLSLKMADKVMFSYYSEMYKDNLLKAKGYSENQFSVVVSEEKISMDKLANIDSEILGQFCLKRFDILSRKMQENKLKAK